MLDGLGIFYNKNVLSLLGTIQNRKDTSLLKAPTSEDAIISTAFVIRRSGSLGTAPQENV